MKYIFELFKTNLKLSKAEAVALFPDKNAKLYDNYLILTATKQKINQNADRLAYIKRIYQFLSESTKKQLENNLKKINWNKIYEKNFSVRINTENKKPITEQQVAKIIWNSVKTPKVKLKNAATQINIIKTKKILVGKLIHIQNDSYEQRRSHLRPRPSPISLHPKLARAMINLSGVKKTDTIVDPFCGSGGILIEAGLMGMKVIGYDINIKMIWKSIVNLKHYKIKNPVLKEKDFFKLNRKYNHIISDVPYGLNASVNKNIRVTKQNRKKQIKELEEFYSKIIQNLDNITKKRAVIIFPNYSNYKKLLKKTNLHILNEFDNYIHSNLTRKIVVLEKRK